MISERCEITPTWDLSEDEWRELRYDGLGGSEIGTLMGLNKYQSPYNLWAVKSRRIPAFEGNEATDWGHDLEPVVLKRLARSQGLAIVAWPVFLRSKQCSFMTANLDGVVVEPCAQLPAGEVTTWHNVEEPPNIIGIAEAKSGGIVSPGNPKDWFLDGASIPITYHIQGMWYMDIAVPTIVYYGALLGGHGLILRTLEYDADTAANLVEAARVFWDRIVNNDPPPIDNMESTEEALKGLFPRHVKGKTVEGRAALAKAWERLQQAKEDEAAAACVRQQARNDVLAILGDAEYGAVDGTVICSFRASKDSERIDSDRLKQERPDWFEQYKKTSPGARQLRAIT